MKRKQQSYYKLEIKCVPSHQMKNKHTLACRDKLVCCSTAAGPAFEGAGITMGMMGKPGAVDKVRANNGKLDCTCHR